MRVTNIDERDRLVPEKLFEKDGNGVSYIRVLLGMLRVQTGDKELKDKPVITEHVILREAYFVSMPEPGPERE